MQARVLFIGYETDVALQTDIQFTGHDLPVNRGDTELLCGTLLIRSGLLADEALNSVHDPGRQEAQIARQEEYRV